MIGLNSKQMHCKYRFGNHSDQKAQIWVLSMLLLQTVVNMSHPNGISVTAQRDSKVFILRKLALSVKSNLCGVIIFMQKKS